MIGFLVFCCFYAVTLCENDQSRVVHLAQGPVRGYKDPEDGIYCFYSIPYATVPKGTDRFKAPLPAPEWPDIFEAVDREIICPQGNLMNILTESKQIKEDCLITNIYVPEADVTNLPVVVYVHGGGNVIGWGNMFTPKKLVKSQKVIAVTFNYRLGPHGFLCLGTKNVPGNAGMKDQVALIRWVKKNILQFGGNPDDITISGYSTGSSSVDILILSKMTKGYFKKVIPESSGGIAPFSVQLDPIENAKEYAKLLKFDNVEDIYALEEYYKSVPIEILNSVQVTDRKDSVTLMAPCIERDVGQELFLHDSPVNILKSSDFEKLPLLYGFTDMDGLLRFPEFNIFKKGMNIKYSDFLPADLQFKDKIEKEKVAGEIKRFYFGDKAVNEETILAYIDYFTDIMFAYPMLRSVKYQVEAGHDQIYLYLYSYVDDGSAVISHTNKRGANHCAQTFAILDGFWNDTSRYTVDENNVSENLRRKKVYMKKIWLNFMITGKPIPEGSDMPAWPPVKSDRSPYMSINKTLELIQGSPLKSRTEFWDKIYDKYYRHPIPPMLPTKYRNLNG